MSDAADKLAQTRLAIIAHLQRREKQHERGRGDDRDQAADDGHEQEYASGRRAWARGEHRPRSPAGWFGHMKHVLGTWWRHHPAHMGVELATPALSAYAERKPMQYLAIAAGVGAVLMLLRPWRLISVTGLIVALVKSSQLSSLVLSAMSGAEYGRDPRPPV
jgi:hypothetical protein